MLDFETVPRVAPKMPVDFATYLLSSSPPATNLELLSFAFSPEAARNWSAASRDSNDNFEVDNSHTKNIQRLRKSLKPIIIRKDDFASDGEASETSSATNSGRVTPTSPCSPRSNKKVSFADHKGFALATVRIMTEASDQPPKLGHQAMHSITKGEQATVSGLPPFKLGFTQPASDYMAFRDKIEKQCVSLENVILRDYNVLGTIKVKNICFDKRVFVRSTFDSWKTSQDIEAKFVQPFGGNLVHNFDTFSFEFNIDSQCDTNNKVMFCVCFETPSGQYWDNNNSNNYEIIPTDFNSESNVHHHIDPLPTSTDASLKSVHSWPDYSCWRHVDTSSPYY
ncbi:Protein phosphatase 1 regulatory subunit 3B [Mactra antiquata]